MDDNKFFFDNSFNELIEDDDKKFVEFLEDKYEDRKILKCLLNEIDVKKKNFSTI